MLTRLAPGDRLPSSRDLVRQFKVSPVTVSRAIAQLATEGAVVTRPGSGTFAATATRSGASVDTDWQTVTLTDRSIDTSLVTDARGTRPEGTVALDGGYLHRSLQPTRALSAALARAARRPDAWDRAPANGLIALRTIFASFAGPGVTPSDVLITSGGQSALSMAFRAMAAPGSPVLVESPTYPGAIAAARAAGLRLVPVPMDSDGVRPDLLADAFAMTGARIFYSQPALHNPTGVTLSGPRRAEIAEIVKAQRAFIIEDDFARHLSHGTPVARPLLADDHDGSVVYVTSLTKPAAPSLRIGALIARGPVMERLRSIRLVDDFFVTRPLQEAAVELVSSPAWNTHLKTLAAALRERCAALAAAVARERPDWTIARVPRGGLHLWIQLPPGTDDNAAAGVSRQHGVTMDAGSRFFATEPTGSFTRLCFAAPADLAGLAEGARRLSQV